MSGSSPCFALLVLPPGFSSPVRHRRSTNLKEPNSQDTDTCMSSCGVCWGQSHPSPVCVMLSFHAPK